MSSIRSLTVPGFSGLMKDGDERRAIVFLHGIGGNAATFVPLFEAWTGGQRLVAWDAPGYGGTASLSEPWPAARDYAARLNALRIALGAPVIDVVGQSLGCLIAGAYARHWPQHVRRIALMAPALGNRVLLGSPLPDAVKARIDDIVALGPTAFAERRAPRLVHRAEDRKPVVAIVRRAMAALEPGSYGQACRMLASGDLLDEARHVQARALVLNGADDVVTPVANAESLAAAFSARTPTLCIVIADAGHAVSIEHPDLVAGHLRAFLQGPE